MRHSELLGSGAIEGAQLAAVCDVVPGRAKELGEKFDVPWFADMDEMMESVACDAVAILTESGNHAAHTIRLARHRKHIIVEKPMALLLDDADRMIEACVEAGVMLFVVKQNRFNVPVVKLREALDGGRFGKLVMGTVRVRWCRPQSYYDQAAWRGTWSMDGGVLTNQASHHVDLLEWMMGDVVSVSAMAATRLADIEAEDTITAILTFRNGALGVIEATTATRPNDLEGSLSILGDSGSVVIGGFAVNQIDTWAFSSAESGEDDVLRRFSVNPPDVYGFGHRAYYEHVVDCISRGRSQLVDGYEGRKSLELITAIYEAAESGNRVHLRYSPAGGRLGR